MANLFNNHPGLEPPEEELTVIEETREEKVWPGLVSDLIFYEVPGYRCSVTG